MPVHDVVVKDSTVNKGSFPALVCLIIAEEADEIGVLLVLHELVVKWNGLTWGGLIGCEYLNAICFTGLASNDQGAHCSPSNVFKRADSQLRENPRKL